MMRLSRYRLMIALLLILNMRAQAALMLNTNTQWNGATPELFVLPVFMNGVEIKQQILGALDTTNNTIYVDLIDFVTALGFEYDRNNAQFVIDTVIGTAQIPDSLTLPLDDRLMVSLQTAGEKLAMQISFDQSSFALYANAAWLSDANASANAIQPSGNARTIEASPGKASLSYLRNEYFYRSDDNSENTFSQTDVGGALLGGAWQLRVRDYVENDAFFEDYVWVQTRRNHRVLLGNQVVALNPLLPGTDFTGAQTAWSNRNIDFFLRNIQTDQLISDSRSPIRSFKGAGVAGGIVQLRIEGVPVAETIALLDNSFVFRDVEVPSGVFVNIEAWVFEPNAEGIPVKVIDFSGFNSNENLPDGTWLVQAGAGLNGNVIEQDSDDLNSAVYLRNQYTFNPSVTLENIIQSIDGDTSVSAGIRGYWGPLGFWEADVAGFDGDSAWRLETRNRGRQWFFRGAAQYRPDAWLNSTNPAYSDRFAEFGWEVDSELELSLVARQFKFDNQDVDFILPAVRWRPRHNMYIRSRPDANGDYVHQAQWRISQKQNIALSASAFEDNLLWRYQFNQQNRFTLQHIDRDSGGQRTAALFQHAGKGLRSLGWSVGLLHGRQRTGYLAHVDYEFIPGLKMRAQVLRDPLGVNHSAPLDTVVGINLVANFNIGRSGYSRGSFYQPLDNKGSVSGMVLLPADESKAFDLSGLKILINGQIRARTEALGRFTIPYLDPGIYEVKLDWDGLPLSVSPVKDTYWVEVAAGANTAVKFKTQLLLGISGRLQDIDGNLLKHGSFAIHDRQGALVIESQTNGFGQLRVDGLAPGEYQLQSNGQKMCPLIQLSDTYLINQIFYLSEQPCEKGDKHVP
ncbi:collagen binding domain-containing protein [Marinicella sp. W31]|uniref:MSCRAMM family protein n=1 Tax=Marinicella sp. W31 TaxID=3023713 RepID=UPI00375710A1